MISDLAYVSPEAKLGENVTVHPFAHIDKNVVIGDNYEIMPYASIVGGTRIGNNVKVCQGSIIGADPQDFRWKGDETYCYIGNNVTIREHVIINRGIWKDRGTKVGDDSFVMAKSHIGHDTVIDGKSVIGNGVQISGNVHIEECTILSSNVLVYDGSNIGKWSMVKGGCRINGNVPPYVIIAHNPVAYYGVNAYILRNKGFAEKTIDEIAKAYRHIYQCGTTLYNALKRIKMDIEQSPERDEIVNFVEGHDMHLVAVQTHSEYID